MAIVALKLLDTNCVPQQVDNHGYTTLIYTCKNKIIRNGLPATTSR